MSGRASERGLVQRVFDACLLLLGAAIAVSVAVHVVEHVLPWLIGGGICAAALAVGRFLWLRWTRW